MKKNLQLTEIELKKLKETVQLLQEEIREKNRLLREYETDWALKLFNDLETIQGEYSVLLKPPPLILKGSYKNQGYRFQIEVGDIIGLFSRARTKMILLNKSVSDNGGSELTTDVIYTETAFTELLHQLDRSNFYFCQVNRSCCVNIRYYSMTDNEVVTDKIVNPLFDRYSHCKVSKRYVADFIAKKKAYRQINSLQKDQLRNILDFIIAGVTSFTNKKTMSKAIKPADNSANQQNPNKGTPGTNKQYSQNQGNRGKQMNPKSSGKKGK